jgi:hypothetical protein
MIYSLEVCYDEIDVVDTNVVGGAELDWQCDLSREHSLERCVVRLELFLLNV